MLLIIFFGLFATLTSGSSVCNVGNKSVRKFDFNEASGTWYVLLHSKNTFEDNFKCVVANYGLPKGNVSSVTVEAFDISQQSYSTLYGNVTNLDNNLFDEIFNVTILWSGHYNDVATDYRSYAILKLCSFQDNNLYVYVAFRSKNPGKETLQCVAKELQKNKIDINQLVDWPAC